MREERDSFDSTRLCATLLLSTSGRKLDMACLIKELFMRMKWKIGRSVYCDFCIVTCEHDWVIGAIEWDIVGGILGVGYTNTLDQTHTTWENPIVAFHVQNHGYRWNITKSSNEVRMERKEFILLGIECGYPRKEFQKFHDHRISERVGVFWLETTRNHASTENVAQMESYIWR